MVASRLWLGRYHQSTNNVLSEVGVETWYYWAFPKEHQQKQLTLKQVIDAYFIDACSKFKIGE